jgi:acetyl-CoA carboxylase biotin carboxyl carrier protein
MEEKDLKELRELVEFLKASGIAEFEMERPDLKVGLRFAGEPAAAEADPHAGAHIVKSPIVGTFYAASSPDAEPFVQVGDTVAVGKVLCIVEAMKLMNEIESDGAGEIVKIFVKPGQPVEYGQALFAVK